MPAALGCLLFSVTEKGSNLNGPFSYRIFTMRGLVSMACWRRFSRKFSLLTAALRMRSSLVLRDDCNFRFDGPFGGPLFAVRTGGVVGK